MGGVEPLMFVVAAILLAVERVTYALIWQFPTTFRAWCAHPALGWLGGPVEVVRALFGGFKVVQVSVFVLWIRVHGGGIVALTEHPGALSLAVACIAVGQCLNLAVFVRLGIHGVFYGNRFGDSSIWVRGFPFSMVAHPQYVGTVLTIWGVFLATRFPFPDWWALPLLESVYYALGSHYESDRA